MNEQIGRGTMGSVGRMVASGSAWLIGARIARSLLTLLGMLVLARLLRPNDFGVLAMAASSTLLAMVAIEGLIDYPALREDELETDMVRSLIWAGYAVMAVFSLAVWFAAPAIERAMAFPDLALGLRAMVPVYFSQVLFIAGNALLRRAHKFATAARISILTVAIYVAVAVVLSIAGMGLASVLAAQVVAQIVTTAMIVRAARVPLAPPRRLRFGDTLHVGGLGAASRLLGWAWTSIDTIIVGIVLGNANTGLYSRAYNINVQMKEPFAAIDQTLRQAFVSIKNREGGVRRQHIMTLRLLSITSGYVAAALFILRDATTALLLGDQWFGAAWAIALLAVGLPARVARLYLDSLCISLGDMRQLVLRHLMILVLIAIGLWLFTDRGIGWVAGVVSGTLYFSLLFMGGRREYEAGAGVGVSLKAMMPGLVFMTVVIAIGEMLPEGHTWLAYSLRTALIAAVGVLLILFTPGAWLGPIEQKRSALISRSFPKKYRKFV